MGQYHPPKKWARIGIFKPAKHHNPWDVCFITWSGDRLEVRPFYLTVLIATNIDCNCCLACAEKRLIAEVIGIAEVLSYRQQ